MSDSATATLEAPDLAQEQTDWGQMSPAERKADIDKALKEVEARHADEDAGETETPAPQDSIPAAKDETPGTGEETPAPADAASQTPKSEGEEVVDDWRNADVKDLAAKYGIDEESLAAIPSREVLDVALRAIDRKAFEAGKPAAKAPETIPQQPVQQGQQADPFADLAKYKLPTGEGQFDEEAAKPFNDFVDTAGATIRSLQAELASFRQERVEQAFKEIRREATTSLHSLGHTDLFGKPGEAPTKEQQANIEKALDAHFTHARGLIASGRQASPTPEFLKAAVNLSFGDQIVNKTKQQHLDALKKQSARRTGGGTTKGVPQAPPEGETTRQAARRIASDPEVQEAWNRIAGKE